MVKNDVLYAVAERAISRGGYKQQTGIIIDSVTQAFYMHEEQRLKDSLVHLKIWRLSWPCLLLLLCFEFFLLRVVPGEGFNHSLHTEVL